MLYLSYAAWYMASHLSKAEYDRASKAFAAAISEAESLFLAKPSRMRSRTGNRHPLTKFLQGIDGPTNCYPSLHVAFAVLTYEIVKGIDGIELQFRDAMKTISVDLCRSTMKIRQHSVVDVIGGYSLAERTYKEFISGDFEPILGAILPELTETELLAVEKVLGDRASLLDLLPTLLDLFSKEYGREIGNKMCALPCGGVI